MRWEDLDQRVLTIAKVIAILVMVAATVGAYIGVEFSPALLGLAGSVLLAGMTASALGKSKKDIEDGDEE